MTQIVRFKDVVKLNKKELMQLGAAHSQKILDEGLSDSVVLMVEARKAAEYIKAFIEGLDYSTRLQLTQDPEAYDNVYGAALNLGSTGDRLAYESDDEYQRINARLKHRKELIDLAYRSFEPVLDGDGAEVPKVKVKLHSKEVLKVKL